MGCVVLIVGCTLAYYWLGPMGALVTFFGVIILFNLIPDRRQRND